MGVSRANVVGAGGGVGAGVDAGAGARDSSINCSSSDVALNLPAFGGCLKNVLKEL